MTQTMLDRLQLTATQKPNHVFSSFEGRKTTFSELWLHAKSIAAALKNFQLTETERVLYLGKNSDRLIEIIYGCAAARNTCVVLNWRLTISELIEISQDAKSKIIFTDAEMLPMATKVAQDCGISQIIVIDAKDQCAATGGIDYDSLLSDFEPMEPISSITADDDFLQLYTSGTTGRPKGVPQTHSMHLSQLAQWESTLGPWPEDDCCLVFMPFFHAAGITYPLFAINYGTQVEIHRGADINQISESLLSGSVTTMVAVPTLLSIFATTFAPGQVTSLRTIHYGGSRVSPIVLKEAMRIFACDFVQIYAATETTAALSILGPKDHHDQALASSCGKPSSLAKIKVIDSNHNTLPPNEVGEIAIKSESVLKGYWCNEEASKAVLIDGWYHTGDLGKQDENGYLYIVDRLKDMIISGGENVYSAEVENVLAAHPAIFEHSVIGTPDSHFIELVTAIVVLRQGMTLTLEQLQEFARMKLAGYKIPRKLVFVDALPKNSLGKIQKQQLRKTIEALV